MSFIEKYNQFKQKYLIVEGTVKSMIPQLQQKLLGDKKWVDLNDEEKKNIHFLHSDKLLIRVLSFALLISYIVFMGQLNGKAFIYFQF